MPLALPGSRKRSPNVERCRHRPGRGGLEAVLAATHFVGAPACQLRRLGIASAAHGTYEIVRGHRGVAVCVGGTVTESAPICRKKCSHRGRVGIARRAVRERLQGHVIGVGPRRHRDAHPLRVDILVHDVFFLLPPHENFFSVVTDVTADVHDFTWVELVKANVMNVVRLLAELFD